ncbi:hypothetical protein IP68_12290 [Blastomonas sp. AAP25]|uniref:hypothetical protein n=1 Tax=Blastomonas sp. AAP25 TaxID=1523416 RepID=UPI0006B9B22E|nr:hypothetical protein [Blastomonas sp. AAP25]KPF74542.1 hypothetical protein IP68_12290 [Blastomonas sp. AAP25]
MSAGTHQTAACHSSIATDGIDGATAKMRNTYTAWKVNAFRAGQVQPIKGDGPILPDFAQSVAVHCSHKDTFIVLEKDALTRGQWLHTYQVKRKSKPRYVLVDHHTRAVHDLYAEHVLTVEVSAFQPVEVWAWSPGADTVGRDAGLIEVSA